MSDKLKNLEFLRTADRSDIKQIVDALSRQQAGERADAGVLKWYADELATATDEVVDAMLDSQGHKLRNDATGGIFLERLVRGGINTVFRHEFPRRKWLNDGLIPIDMSLSDGATSWDAQSIEAVGQAALISDDASDVPMADIRGKSEVRPIHIYGIGYRYNRREMRTARLQGRFDISTERAVAAREGHDNKMDEVLFRGDSDVGTKGIINTPGILQETANTGTWNSATAAQIIEDFGLAFETIPNDTEGVEEANTVVMPIDLYGRLMRLPASLAGDANYTVMRWLRENYPQITRWEKDPRMSTGDLAGTGKSVLMYDRSPSRIRAMMPMRMRPTTPEQRGLGWSVLFETMYGGLYIQRPKSVLNLSGV